MINIVDRILTRLFGPREYHKETIGVMLVMVDGGPQEAQVKEGWWERPRQVWPVRKTAVVQLDDAPPAGASVEMIYDWTMKKKHDEVNEVRQLREEMLNLLADFTERHGWMARNEAYFNMSEQHLFTLYQLPEFAPRLHYLIFRRANEVGSIFGIPVVLNPASRFVCLVKKLSTNVAL
jgi:hypothetical protein